MCRSPSSRSRAGSRSAPAGMRPSRASPRGSSPFRTCPGTWSRDTAFFGRLLIRKSALRRRASGFASQPVGHEWFRDPVLAVGAVDELVARQRLQRTLDRRRAGKLVPAPVVAAERSPTLTAERLEREPLDGRRLVPDQLEVGMLRPQDVGESALVLGGPGPAALRRLLPEEVAEL